MQKYEYIINEYVSDIKDAINLTEGLDSFEYIPETQNDNDLGYHYIE